MATATCHGQLHKFDVVNETVTAYLERAELYFDTNDVADEIKIPVLLSNVAKPSGPEDFRQDKRTLLKSHFEPTPSMIAER